jgi:hypothetical protein
MVALNNFNFFKLKDKNIYINEAREINAKCRFKMWGEETFLNVGSYGA